MTAQARHTVPLENVFSGQVREQSLLEVDPKDVVVFPPGQKEVQVLEVDPIKEEE